MATNRSKDKSGASASVSKLTSRKPPRIEGLFKDVLSTQAAIESRIRKLEEMWNTPDETWERIKQVEDRLAILDRRVDKLQIKMGYVPMVDPLLKGQQISDVMKAWKDYKPPVSDAIKAWHEFDVKKLDDFVPPDPTHYEGVPYPTPEPEPKSVFATPNDKLDELKASMRMQGKTGKVAEWAPLLEMHMKVAEKNEEIAKLEKANARHCKILAEMMKDFPFLAVMYLNKVE